MRRGPTIVMCAVTGMVVVANLRAGAGVHLSAAGVQPSGVVLLTPATHAPAHAPTHKPVRKSTKRSTTAKRTHSPTSTWTKPAQHPTATSTRTTAPKPAPKPTATRTTSVVVNGRGVDTRYGLVQVQITISGHRITKATAIAHPHGSGTTDQINSYAIPQLDSETINAQSANIDTVSGATYTSDGYRTSLQSALDAARSAGVW